MVATDDLRRLKLIWDPVTSPLLSVSLLMFSFLPSFCFVHSCSWGTQCQAHIQCLACFWLPAHSWRQLKCFSPAGFFPLTQPVVTFPSHVPLHGNQSSCQTLWSLPPPQDFVSQSQWVLSCIFLLWISCFLMFLDNTFVTQWQTHDRHTWGISKRLLNSYLAHGIIFGVNWFKIILLICLWLCVLAISTHVKIEIIGCVASLLMH